jgi:hypothetical protein
MRNGVALRRMRRIGTGVARGRKIIELGPA